MSKPILSFLPYAAAALVFLSLPALAQQDAPPPPEQQQNPQAENQEMITPQNTALDMKAPVDINDLQSLFFTFWEHSAIRDARNSRGMVRAPTEDELRRAREASAQRLDRPPPGIRELSLGGIVYASGNDWTIWLNGTRVTPDALPEELLDLQVHKEYVEMKWLDEYTGQIFPVRLRPHQRFNLDSRIFLPG